MTGWDFIRGEDLLWIVLLGPESPCYYYCTITGQTKQQNWYPTQSEQVLQGLLKHEFAWGAAGPGWWVRRLA